MEKKIEVRDFAIAFASNAIAVDDKQRKRLIEEITNIFSWSDIDYVKDWDHGLDGSLGMGDLLTEAYSEDYYYDEDKDEYVRIEGSLEDEVACAVRTAIDLFVSPSGGVFGFTVGDLKKAFDGIIPEWVSTLYKSNLNMADEEESIWL